MTKAVCASSSLKHIHIEKVGIHNISQAEEASVCAIMRHHSQRLFSFSCNLVGSDASSDFSNVTKSILLHPDCKLKCLQLHKLQHCRTLDDEDHYSFIIAEGLANNTSLKHISYDGESLHLLLRNTPNHTLRSLDFNKCAIDLKSAVALKGINGLKRLRIHRCEVTPESMQAAFYAVLSPTSKLKELLLNDSELNDAMLQVLGECMARNASLKTLDLSKNYRITSSAWTAFFSEIFYSDTEVEHINLSDNGRQLNDGVLSEMAAFLTTSRTYVKTLNLKECYISSDGCQLLLRMLHKTPIESFHFLQWGSYTIESLPISTYRLLNGRLKALSLGNVSPKLSIDMFEVLDDPNCRLEQLAFNCEFDNSRLLMNTIREWVKSLEKNATLKELDVELFIQKNVSLASFWLEFLHLIQKPDSSGTRGAHETFDCNHTLHSLKITRSSIDDDDDEDLEVDYEDIDECPQELYYYLQMNSNQDKRAVACMKVIQANFSGPSGTQRLLEEFAGSKKVPHVLSSIGQVKALSVMYDFLRAMPSLLEGAVTPCDKQSKKRKMQPEEEIKS
jgi:hypothetical protein